MERHNYVITEDGHVYKTDRCITVWLTDAELEKLQTMEKKQVKEAVSDSIGEAWSTIVPMRDYIARDDAPVPGVSIDKTETGDEEICTDHTPGTPREVTWDQEGGETWNAMVVLCTKCNKILSGERID